MDIRATGLSKRFGTFQALSDATFEVESGSLVALLGPSGSGKSTILRILAGLEVADAGSVFFAGAPADHLDPRVRAIGFVFQHYALFRHMTVAENVGFGLRARGVDKKTIAKRVNEMLDLTSLGGLAERYPTQLSGGQRQRVALARALAPEPKMLLLDEPFAAVDAKVRDELRQWLRRLHDEVGVTSMFVTHDQAEAFEVADRVLVVNNGRIEQQGSPLDILDHPSTEFVARFVGDANVLDGFVTGGVAQAGLLRMPVHETRFDGPARIIIRAYDMKFIASTSDAVATIKRLVPLGDQVKVEAKLDDGSLLIARFPRRSSLLHGVEVGTRIRIDVTLARAYPRAESGAVELTSPASDSAPAQAAVDEPAAKSEPSVAEATT
jgi:sulfate transport system ATP-binding protein